MTTKFNLAEKFKRNKEPAVASSRELRKEARTTSNYPEEPKFDNNITSPIFDESPQRPFAGQLKLEREPSSPNGPRGSGDLGSFERLSCKPLRRKSRLSRTLFDTLTDPTVLAHFIQFMDYKGVRHLVKFWLEAECFRVSAAGVLSRGVNSSVQGCSPDTPERSVLSAEEDPLKAQESNNCLHNNEAMASFTQRDAVNIFSKYISKEAVSPIGVTDELRNRAINEMCQESGELNPGCFREAQSFVLSVIDKRYFPEFLKSPYYCKHLVEILTSGSVSLSDIIYNESALFHFMEWADEMNIKTWLEFLLAADNFHHEAISTLQQESAQENLPHSTQLQEDALVLYDRYFSLQAITPLGFDDSLRLALENNICQETGPGPDCFAVPMYQIWKQLEKEYLPKFLNSESYLKYVAELVNKSRNHYELPNPSGRRQLNTTASAFSDRSSGDMSVESSQSCPSTQRPTRRVSSDANGRAVFNRRQQVQNIPSENMNIDLREASQPEKLWERTGSQSGLTLGHIDGLGQFVKESNDITPRKPESKKAQFRGAIKNLVNREPNEAEQKIASEIAQLIVQDISNMTLEGGEDILR